VLILVVRRVAIRRLAPLLSVAALTTMATGVINARIHIEAPELLTHRAYGWVLIGKITLVVTALLLARVVARSGRRVLLRVEAVALVGAAVAGVALTVLPGLNSSLSGLSVVAPATTDAECRSQIEGAFAAVHEQRPTSTLTFIDGSQPVSPNALRVPDCNDGSDDLETTAASLTSTLARGGAHQLIVVVDQDPRGYALAQYLGATTVDASAARSAVGDTVIVATSWTHADEAQRDVRTALRRVILAPWLLQRALLEPAVTDTASGQVAIVTQLDPTGPAGVAYVQALAQFDATLEPSAAGLNGYRRMRSLLQLAVPALGRPKLFTPVNLAFLPPELDQGHAHGTTSGWLAVGDLAPLT
jgi:hypothetical protein